MQSRSFWLQISFVVSCSINIKYIHLWSIWFYLWAGNQPVFLLYKIPRNRDDIFRSILWSISNITITTRSWLSRAKEISKIIDSQLWFTHSPRSINNSTVFLRYHPLSRVSGGITPSFVAGVLKRWYPLEVSHKKHKNIKNREYKLWYL